MICINFFNYYKLDSKLFYQKNYNHFTQYGLFCRGTNFVSTTVLKMIFLIKLIALLYSLQTSSVMLNI